MRFRAVTSGGVPAKRTAVVLLNGWFGVLARGYAVTTGRVPANGTGTNLLNGMMRRHKGSS
jgi:hypothetical protein